MFTSEFKIVSILAASISIISGLLLIYAISKEIILKIKQRKEIENFACNPPKMVSNSGLGKIEKNINDLQEVVILCHRVESPKDELLTAVRSNINKGCKYSFFVTNVNKTDKDKNFNFFLSLAEIATDITSKKIEELVQIEPIPFSWQDKPPIIFYRTKPNGKLKTIAYRGYTAGEGIDELYHLVDPILGHALLEMLFDTIKYRNEDVHQTEFIDQTKIVNIKNFNIPRRTSSGHP